MWREYHFSYRVCKARLRRANSLGGGEGLRPVLVVRTADAKGRARNVRKARLHAGLGTTRPGHDVVKEFLVAIDLVSSIRSSTMRSLECLRELRNGMLFSRGPLAPLYLPTRPRSPTQLCFSPCCLRLFYHFEFPSWPTLVASSSASYPRLYGPSPLTLFPLDITAPHAPPPISKCLESRENSCGELGYTPNTGVVCSSLLMHR